MSKRIPLTQGKFAIVDDADYEWLNQYKWHAHKDRNTFYAWRRSGKETVLMHRQILGLVKGDGKQTDHVNHNGLDNKRCNIRICTNAQNHQNQLSHKDFRSKYKGVSWSKKLKKWRSCIRQNYKTIHLGYYNNETEAAKAYDNKAKELFGEFAHTNFTAAFLKEDNNE